MWILHILSGFILMELTVFLACLYVNKKYDRGHGLIYLFRYAWSDFMEFNTTVIPLLIFIALIGGGLFLMISGVLMLFGVE